MGLGIGLNLGVNRTRAFGVSFSPLLDDYSGAAAAYSLRQLSSTYSGDAIVVTTNGSDSASIGFVNNELDTASLEAFAGSGDAYVSVWYDQSGNGNNATQTNLSNMPKIVSAGSTILEGGKPIIQTQPTAHFNMNAALNTSDATTQFIAGKSGISRVISNTFYAGGHRYILASKQGDTANTFIIVPDASYINGSSFTFTDRDNTYSNTTAQSLISLYWANPSHESLIKIGWTSTSWAMWSTQELIIYNNDQSGNISDIETNINSYYSIY